MERQITINVPQSFVDVLRAEARRDYTTVSQILRSMIAERYRDRLPRSADGDMTDDRHAA
jgi:hypothetical protein